MKILKPLCPSDQGSTIPVRCNMVSPAVPGDCERNRCPQAAAPGTDALRSDRDSSYPHSQLGRLRKKSDGLQS